MRNWGNAEKIQKKLENSISFEQYLVKFWKKITGIFGKTSGHFEHFWESF